MVGSGVVIQEAVDWYEFIRWVVVQHSLFIEIHL